MEILFFPKVKIAMPFLKYPALEIEYIMILEMSKNLEKIGIISIILQLIF